MKILVASDNHREETGLYDLLNIYDDIDLWLHCGDSEFGIHNPLWSSFNTVKGNMDWENAFPNIRIEEVNDNRFIVVHGHNHQVRKSYELLLEEATKYNAGVVFYGHTHIAKVDQVNGVYFINPGSISQPRGSLQMGSYAIYENNEENSFIHFYDWNHNKIQELSQKLK